MRRFLLPLLLAPFVTARAEPIGEVDTVFKWVGPDHKIVVLATHDLQWVPQLHPRVLWLEHGQITDKTQEIQP